ARLLVAQSLAPALDHPAGKRMAQRQEAGEIATFLGKAERGAIARRLPQNGVDEAGGALPRSPPGDIHRLVDGGRSGNPIEVEYLVEGDAKRREERGMDPLEVTAGEPDE